MPASEVQAKGKQVSAPVEVVPGVMKQKVGNTTVTSTAQAFGDVGKAVSLDYMPDIPVLTPKDFSKSFYAVKPSKENRSSWDKAQSYQITAVQDGDTVHGKVPSKDALVKCRVTGIDADETPHEWKGQPGQKYGKYGADTMKKLIANGDVSVQISMNPGDISEGRNICLITVKGKNLSTSLVEAGAAYVYRQFVKPEMAAELDKAESKAMKAGSGVWADPDKERPWDYRQRYKRLGKK
jgi:endonuclease YncB( thermonuclease family)